MEAPMVRFSIKHLQEDQFDAAFPLVRTAAPHLQAEDWRHFARRLISGEGGVLTVSAGDGPPYGVAVYRLDYSLRHGRTLEIELIVTFELEREAPARAALCEMLELIALAKDCRSLTITTASKGYAASQSPRAGAWASLGLNIDSVIFAKRLKRQLAGVGAPGAVHD